MKNGSKWKVSLLLVLLVSLSLFMVGCGNSEKSVDGSESSSSNKAGDVIDTEEKFQEVYSDPNKFKGDSIEFNAQIFLEPETDGDGTYFQCYAYNNENLNTIVAFNEKSDLKDEDVVLIKGKVRGKIDAENAFGGDLSLLGIDADSVEKTDYATALAPAIKTIELNEEIDQHGYLMKVEKVEFAEEETRVYVSITNNTKDNISFYSFDSKATQGSKQLKEEDSYGKGYPEIDSEILPGVTEEGIVLFSKSDVDEPLKIYLEGSSDNYELDFDPFIFEVKE